MQTDRLIRMFVRISVVVVLRAALPGAFPVQGIVGADCGCGCGCSGECGCASGCETSVSPAKSSTIPQAIYERRGQYNCGLLNNHRP